MTKASQRNYMCVCNQAGILKYNQYYLLEFVTCKDLGKSVLEKSFYILAFLR